MDNRVRALIILAVTLVVGMLGGTIIWNDDEQPPPVETVTVPDAAPAGDLAAPPEDTGDDPADAVLRDETPPGAAPQTLEEGAAEADRIQLEPKEVGGAQNYSIQQDFSGAVYSSRNGAKTLNFIVHCTVSPNLPGWGDVYAIRDYFKRTRIASATFIGDFEGHILQMVPRDQKPWTTGWFNPWSETIEIISTCTESRAQWMASKLISEGILSSLMRDEMNRAGIPIRRVDPVGCTVPTGYFDHAHAECGNFHTDISYGCRSLTGEPTYTACNFPWEVLGDQLAQKPCGKRCQALQDRHKAAHRRYRERDCRATMHKRKLSELRRPECRRVKKLGHEQHRKLHKRWGL
jgi:hypothetical protein